MTAFTGILTSKCRVMRNTSVLLEESSVSALMYASRQPKSSARLNIIITNASVGGTVHVSGNTDESFVFAANGESVGSENFTRIDGLTIQGLSGGLIEIKAVTPTGQSLVQKTQVYGSIPCRLFTAKGRNITVSPGQTQQNRQKLMFAPTTVIKDNDEIYPVLNLPGFDMAKITFVDTLYDFAGATHHIECDFE